MSDCLHNIIFHTVGHYQILTELTVMLNLSLQLLILVIVQSETITHVQARALCNPRTCFRCCATPSYKIL